MKNLLLYIAIILTKYLVRLQQQYQTREKKLQG